MRGQVGSREWKPYGSRIRFQWRKWPCRIVFFLSKGFHSYSGGCYRGCSEARVCKGYYRISAPDFYVFLCIEIILTYMSKTWSWIFFRNLLNIIFVKCFWWNLCVKNYCWCMCGRRRDWCMKVGGLFPSYYVYIIIALWLVTFFPGQPTWFPRLRRQRQLNAAPVTQLRTWACPWRPETASCGALMIKAWLWNGVCTYVILITPLKADTYSTWC